MDFVSPFAFFPGRNRANRASGRVSRAPSPPGAPARIRPKTPRSACIGSRRSTGTFWSVGNLSTSRTRLCANFGPSQHGAPPRISPVTATPPKPSRSVCKSSPTFSATRVDDHYHTHASSLRLFDRSTYPSARLPLPPTTSGSSKRRCCSSRP